MRRDVVLSSMCSRVSLAAMLTGAWLRVSMQAGPIGLISRTIDPDVACAFDAFDAAALPVVDVTGPVDELHHATVAGLGTLAIDEGGPLWSP